MSYTDNNSNSHVTDADNDDAITTYCNIEEGELGVEFNALNPSFALVEGDL